MGEHHQPILNPQLSDPSTISLPSGTFQRRADNHLPTWNRNRIDGKIRYRTRDRGTANIFLDIRFLTLKHQ